MADTIRLISDLITIFRDNQFGTITAQDMRDALVTLSPPETILAYSSNIAWNIGTAPVSRVVLTGSTTVTISGGEVGRAYRLAIVQGGTGNNSVVLSGVTVLGTPVWKTAVNDINLLNIDISGAVSYATVI